jgi:hypothetical protein
VTLREALRLAVAVFLAAVFVGMFWNGPTTERLGVYLLLVAVWWTLLSFAAVTLWILALKVSRRSRRKADRPASSALAPAGRSQTVRLVVSPGRMVACEAPDGETDNPSPRGTA